MSLVSHACNCPYCPGNPLRQKPAFEFSGPAVITFGRCQHPVDCRCDPGQNLTFSSCPTCNRYHCNRITIGG